MPSTGKKRLSFDSNGWASLSSGVRIHHSGNAFCEFRSPILQNAQFFKSELESGKIDIKETEDYAEFDFRMLTAGLIEGYWIDFTKPGVLKSATNLFQTKIYTDHKTDVRNSVGVTLSPKYQTRNGSEGVDATFRIFKQFGGDIVARLKTEPPLIDSNSVGVSFHFEKSHPNLEGFYYHLGEKVDGQIVRLIVTKIVSVHETSLVAVGADPNAKKFSLTHEHFFEKFNNSNHKEGKNMPIEVRLTILRLLGVDVSKLGLEIEGDVVDLPSEKISSVLEMAGEQIRKLKSQIQSVEEEKKSLSNNLKELSGLFGLESFPEKFNFADEVQQLQSLLEEPKRILEEYREKALKAYRLSKNGKINPTVETLISGANLEQAKAFCLEYNAKLEELHPVRCEKCGTDKGLTRASGSKTNPEDLEAKAPARKPDKFRMRR